MPTEPAHPLGPAEHARPEPAPNADQHLLALHVLTGRQLRSTFLHGAGRTWRERRRIWPAVLVAAAIVALLIAGVSVVAAFDRQQRLDSAGIAVSEPVELPASHPDRLTR